jgi:hypothetical protein
MEEMKHNKYIELCKKLIKKMHVMDLAEEDEPKEENTEASILAADEEGDELTDVVQDAPSSDEEEGPSEEILEMLRPAKKPKKKEGVLSIAIATGGKKKPAMKMPMGKKAKG